jgi:hypothetical protein
MSINVSGDGSAAEIAELINQQLACLLTSEQEGKKEVHVVSSPVAAASGLSPRGYPVSLYAL